MRLPDRQGWERIVATCLLSLVLILVITQGMPHIGLKVVRIYGQSMEPALSPGDLIVVKESSHLEEGQIAVYRSEDGEGICHRVLIDASYEDRQLYIFKGDNNDRMDSQVVTEDNIEGVMVFHLRTYGMPLWAPVLLAVFLFCAIYPLVSFMAWLLHRRKPGSRTTHQTVVI